MGACEARVDLLVIGLGPAGGSAARVAAGAGLSVLAVDKKRQIGWPVQCAEFLPLPMGAYATAPGVLQQRIGGMQSFLPSGAVHRSDFPGLMIDRACLDRAIAEAAERAGARLATHTRLIALDAAAHVATLEDADGTRQVSYRMLIAADGPHSLVAARLGLSPLACVQTRQYTVPLLQPYQDTDVWLSDEFPGGYAWLFPKGAVANLGLGADRRFEDDLKTPLDALHLRLVAQGLVGETIVARTGGAIPVGGLRERLTVGDVLFVGDAAGLAHPITGAGIAAALISGECAGLAVARSLAGEAEAIDAFEEELRDRFEDALMRAVDRRRWLEGVWRTPAARADAAMRRGWIAFDEYYDHAFDLP
ncbi:MAG: NAD(P)/FAD-dependent oxidoreductase [Ectothiorhodospiraceae bacterium]|jgi:geranylgeranyl reductase family protein|nr:NAD(P)/FAD-dependent oxidoreductase [Ectothiorhodospiraceae bacterium]